uniref:Uncharacterized protein n=1 Tax=Haemonchus contortus TaxID=6289 RepID=A0A7I4XT79_HAECO
MDKLNASSTHSNAQSERLGAKNRPWTPYTHFSSLIGTRRAPHHPMDDLQQKTFIGRRLRSTLDLLKPSHSPEVRPDIVMEMQFNRRHGAKPKKFEPKDLVFARDFRSGQPRWSPGHVLRRRGRTLYDVLVQGSIWKRHANQLRPRDSLGETIDLTNAFDMPFNSSPDSPSGTSSTLPLSPMATTAPLTTTTTTTAPPAPPAVAPRRSTRTRRPPDFLQIDPYAKSYQGRQS